MQWIVESQTRVFVRQLRGNMDRILCIHRQPMGRHLENIGEIAAVILQIHVAMVS